MKTILTYLFTLVLVLGSGTAFAVEVDQTSTAGDNTVLGAEETTAATESTTNEEAEQDPDVSSTDEDTSADNTTTDSSSSTEGDESVDETTPDQTRTRAEMQERLEDPKTDVEQKRLEAQERIEERKAEVEQNIANTKAEIEQKRVEAQERLEERKVEMEQKREEFRLRMDEKKRSLINAYAERMMNRMNIALNRLEGVAERITSRIEKLDPEKFDTSTAIESLAVAEVQIEALRTKIDETLVDFETAYDAADPQTEFANIRTTIQAIAADIRDVHQTLVDAVATLRTQVTDEAEAQTGDTTPEGDTEEETPAEASGEDE
jgi:hypothetical protein